MKQKILAEIERLKDKGKYRDTYDYAFRDGNNDALDAIARFINSLPEEPKEYDLVKFADWQSIGYRKQRESCGLKDPITLNEVEEANYAGIMTGAKWQKEQIMLQAIDGLVICDKELTGGYKDIVFAMPKDLNVGDKVKLIIVRKD